MNEELHKRLVEDLKKSGFGSEMRVQKIFQDLGWDVSSGKEYLDKDEDKSRELDISAWRMQLLQHNNKLCAYNFFNICAEVKKSEKPWVVFRQSTDGYFDSWNNLITCRNLPSELKQFYKYILKTSLLKNKGWAGSGIHEAFKDPKNPSTWYQAFLSVCKASENEYEINKYKEKEHTSDIMIDRSSFNFIQPLVILDGILVTAELSDSGEIILEEVTSAPFNFQFKTKQYKRHSYRVDLVTITGLPEYLEYSEKRQLAIAEGFRELSGYPLEELKDY